jgi:hypothetical protein
MSYRPSCWQTSSYTCGETYLAVGLTRGVESMYRLTPEGNRLRGLHLAAPAACLMLLLGSGLARAQYAGYAAGPGNWYLPAAGHPFVPVGEDSLTTGVRSRVPDGWELYKWTQYGRARADWVDYERFGLPGRASSSWGLAGAPTDTTPRLPIIPVGPRLAAGDSGIALAGYGAEATIIVPKLDGHCATCGGKRR